MNPKIELSISNNTTINVSKMTKEDDIKYGKFIKGSMRLTKLKYQQKQLEFKLEDVMSNIAILEEYLKDILDE